MKALAVDPGGTTGWCFVESESHPGALNPDNTKWEFGELTGSHHLKLWELLEAKQPHFLLWERFNYQRRELDKGVSLVLDSKEYIGVMQLWVDIHIDSVLVYEQQPSYMKLWDDRKLRAAGLYNSSSPHIRDATRHMLYWLTVTKKNTSFIQLTRVEEGSP